MKPLEKVIAAGALALVAGCARGTTQDVSEEEPLASHDIVVANAHEVLTSSLIDLSEALPHMTTTAEPEA